MTSSNLRAIVYHSNSKLTRWSLQERGSHTKGYTRRRSKTLRFPGCREELQMDRFSGHPLDRGPKVQITRIINSYPQMVIWFVSWISQAKGQRMLYHPRWFIWTIWTVFSELLIFETVCYYFVSQLYNILHFLKEKGDLLLCGKRSILFWQQ